MKPFLDEHFLLQSNTAASLYKNAAKNAPIFDFHCHLDPQEIWENKPFSNITDLWLGGDHYKWRAMRLQGIDEHYITGDASHWGKFEAWAKTVLHCIGNPLYHWTHMELKNVFGINKLLSPETAKEIYDECNEKLKHPDFTPRALIQKSNVVFIGTTDDPLSNLQYHQYIRDDETFETVVAPTFRPDGALFIERPTFNKWIQQLQTVSNIEIDCSKTFLEALQQRVDYFHQHGCCASDHDLPSLDYVVPTAKEFDEIFQKRRQGEELTKDEINGWKGYLLTELGKMYSSKQWVMQLHMGAMRNNNTKMMNKIGPDTGFDSIGEANFAEGVSRFLDALDQQNALPRTILYNLNQKDNQVLAGMMANFTEEGVPGKVQLGSGWWFLDHIDGMERQLKDFANVGLLSHFVGMLTDSRSFLSYARHDYFRRILCNLLGDWIEKGLAPNDVPFFEQMIKNICHDNAKAYFTKRS